MDNIHSAAAGGETKQEREAQLKQHFNQIERFFHSKQEYIQQCRHIPVEEVLRNAPRYYSFLKLIEQINSFLTKDGKWLEHYIDKKDIDFDWKNYNKWKNSIDFMKTNYDDTYCPARWVTLIQEKLIEILKQLQILLYMECYIDEENFRSFVSHTPEVSYKMKANYIDKSIPSDSLTVLFSAIDTLIRASITNDTETKYIIDTYACLEVYRKLDNLKVMDLLKRKDFYVKFRTQYLQMWGPDKRSPLPSEDDIIEVAQMFSATVDEYMFSYREYKQRLMDKHAKIAARAAKKK
ncbi:MAG: hypothetical protein IKQ61_09805 [Spirochaetales bacterium]|nr:hypothetical protein [Spirochaetales bacterium]MBR6200541.1 hypothetical protein [Spirochaetales bacterium]